MTIDLSHPTARRADIGGKGRSLAELLHLGWNVPSGFAVGVDAFLAHLAQPAVALALDACRRGPGPRAARLANLRETICKTSLAPDVDTALTEQLQRLGACAVAVRSSAPDEDGSARSFAGIHDTVLGIATADDIRDAIRRVWASAFGERAVAYRSEAARGSPLDAKMAVVVQRLVAAEVSGVAFSREPGTGADRCVIESVRGLGESLVSGRVTPSRVVVDPSSTIVARSGEDLLGPARTFELLRAVRAIAAAAGAPVDVEWSFGGGRLWILQSRPVTGTAGGDGKPATLQVWSNMNTAEVLPGVATQATFDIAQGYVAQLLGPLVDELGLDLDPRNFVGRVAGRVYFNVNAVVALLGALPAMRPDEFADNFGGEAETMRAAIRRLRPGDLPRTRVGLARFVAGLIRLSWRAIRGGTQVLEAGFRAYVASTRRYLATDVRALADDALVPHIRASITEPFVPREGLAVMMGGMGSVQLLGRLGGAWLGDPSFGARLLTALGGLESAEAGLALGRLGRTARRLGLGDACAAVRRDDEALAMLASDAAREFAAEFEAFLAEHGHHARAEVDAAVPRWRETPAYLLRQVAALAQVPDGTAVLDEERRRATREAMLDAALRRLDPLRRAILRHVVDRATDTLRYRENTKSEAVRRLAHVRGVLLEAGRRLVARETIATPDDVFLCSLDEIAFALTTPLVDWTQRCARRRAELDRLRQLDPPSVVVGEFDPAAAARPAPPTTEDRVLRGLGASAGIAEGPARVVRSTDEGITLLPGEVLVAPFTDPGWTPYFVGASAVVMQFGGQLSHGSIVAREYGLPAVVNVLDAMRVIETGRRLRVDGAAGTVTLLDD